MTLPSPLSETEKSGIDARSILMLDEADVIEVFDRETAIDSQRLAFTELGRGRAQLAPRTLMDGPEESKSFCYTSRVSHAHGAVTKFGSVVPGNAEAGKAVVSAVVVVLDPQDGMLSAILDGTSITTIRTSAASAVAAEALGAAGARTLAVLGTGVQAQAHALSIAPHLGIDRVLIHGRRPEAARAAAKELGSQLGLTVEVAESARSAVEHSQIVALCTTSAAPVIETDWVQPGSLVISVGSFAPDRFEVHTSLLGRSTVVVDHLETALEQAGPVVSAVAEGVIRAEQILTLGEVLLGAPARTEASDIVYYNSVGVGIQDAAAAEAIISRAQQLGKGRQIPWL